MQYKLKNSHATIKNQYLENQSCNNEILLLALAIIISAAEQQQKYNKDSLDITNNDPIVEAMMIGSADFIGIKGNNNQNCSPTNMSATTTMFQYYFVINI